MGRARAAGLSADRSCVCRFSRFLRLRGRILYHTRPMRALASTPARTFVVLLACAISALAQNPVLLDGRPVLMISSDRLTLGVRTEGGAMVRMLLKDDPAGVNALHAELGHFVCVDGFGPVS